MKKLALISSMAMLFVSCHKSPELGGVSLECDNDQHCQTIADDWRCITGVCVRNTPPAIDPLATLYVTLGQEIIAAATADDLDEDEVAFTWQQVGGPEPFLLAEPITGPSLRITPVQLGSHVFQVTADDGYSISAPEVLLAVVQPVANAVYVWNGGDDGDGEDRAPCGTFERPCATVDHGMNVARASGTSPLVLLAAASGNAPYEACLELGGNETIRGCFDPVTWEEIPALRPTCRIECASLEGHNLSDQARLENVTLAMADNIAGGDVDALFTVWITPASQPELDFVDIETATCGDSCTVGGVASVHGSPILRGVNVYGGVIGFDPVDTFLGFLVLGGAPQISGGEIIFNAPADVASIGLILSATEATVSGVSIIGGLAPKMVGVNIEEGRPTLEQIVVDLTSFGTQSMYGIVTSTCETGGAQVHCSCEEWYDDCPVIGMHEIADPLLTVTGSTLRLRSSSAGENSLNPCSGIGVRGDAGAMQHIIDNNTIDIGDQFTLGVGIGLGSSGLNSPPASEITANPLIAVGDADADALCELINALNGEEFSAGAQGISVHQGVEALIRGNIGITVGAHSTESVGIRATQAGWLDIADNVIDVGARNGGLAPTGTGIFLDRSGPVDGPLALLGRNTVRVGDGITSSLGVMLINATYWQIKNNLVHAGPAPHGTGLFFLTGEAVPGLPIIAHNTIHGGGDLTSRAVVSAIFLEDPTGPPGAAVFKNNLLDAGDAVGRRLILDNYGDYFVEAEGNIAQLDGAATVGPAPTLVVPLEDPDSDFGNTSQRWLTLFSGSGEIAALEERATTLQVGEAVALPGAPSVAWSGDVSGTSWVIAAIPGNIAISVVVEGEPSKPVAHSTVTYDDTGAVEHQPKAVAAILLKEEHRQALGFLEDGAAPGLYVMRSKPDGGFGWPELVVGRANTTAIGTTGKGHHFLIASNDGLDRYPGGGHVPRASLTGVASGATIEMVRTMRLNEETVPAPATSDELVIIADGRVHVWRNLDFGNDMSAPLPNHAPFDSQPCATSTITVANGGPVFVQAAAPDPIELIFGCEDGTVEIFEWAAGSFANVMSVATGVSSPVSGVTMTSTSAGPLLAVTWADADTVKSFEFVSTAFQQRASLTLLADVVWREPGGDLENPPSLEIGIAVHSGVPRPCDFVGGNPFDLHLAGGAACIDAGAAIGVTDDIDGCSARGGTPDIGADEFGSTGSPCEHGE